MKKLIVSAMAASAAVAMVPSTASAATLINAGFETGDLTGWSTNKPGLVTVVSSAAALGGTGYTYHPQEGQYFAKLLTDSVTNFATTLTQQVDLVAGQTIAFRAAFDAGDYLPFNDEGTVGVFDFADLASSEILFTESVSTVGNYGDGPWKYVSFTAPKTATYTIQATVKNINDALLPSALYLDLAVPEPSTWAMMLLGFGLVGLSMRRRQNVQVSFA